MLVFDIIQSTLSTWDVPRLLSLSKSDFLLAIHRRAAGPALHVSPVWRLTFVCRKSDYIRGFKIKHSYHRLVNADPESVRRPPFLRQYRLILRGRSKWTCGYSKLNIWLQTRGH